MKRELTVSGLCALVLLVVVACFPPHSLLADGLVVLCMAGALWAFISAFCKA